MKKNCTFALEKKRPYKFMINRILIRIKIFQILYAYFKCEDKTLEAIKKEMFHCFDKAYELYFHLFALPLIITKYFEDRIELRKNKFRPTKADLNPNLRFVENSFVKQLAVNVELNNFIRKNKLSWANYPDVIKKLSEIISNSIFYKEYIEIKTPDYERDKEIWRKIFKRIIAPNKSLEDALEEQSIYWTNDTEIIVSFIVKTIKKFEAENGNLQNFYPQYYDSVEDKMFAEKLLTVVINRDNEFTQLIEKHTSNWEIERIAFIDIVILKMALAEILTFPAVPIDVTMNEYIELAKEYSTEKSSTFVNGVLDGIVDELDKANKLIKVKSF